MSERANNAGGPSGRRMRSSRLFRYSLRGLLALMLLICVLLALYVWLLQDLYKQQAIASELVNLGCKVDWDIPARRANDPSRSAAEQWLIKLIGDDPNAKLRSVECYYPNDEQHLQAVLDAAERLPFLEQLWVAGDIRGFRALPGIQVLVLIGGRAPEATREVGRMTSLRSLALFCKPNDADMTQLRKLQNLASLTLCGDGITSACLPVISELASLEELNLPNTRVGDGNLEFLQSLPHLRRLDLNDSDVTDAAIPALSELKQLEVLNVKWTQITAQGIKQLERALPNTRIVHVYLE